VLKFNLHTVLVIYVSYIFLFSNILAAHLPNLAILFIAIRDLWIFIFIFILFKNINNKHNFIIMLFIFFWGMLGVIPIFINEISIEKIIVFFYGFRDICLIGFVFYVLKNEVKISKATRGLINIFIGFVFIAFCIQNIFQIIGWEAITESIYQYEIYYHAKGIDINLDGGIFGMRPGAPLYSPGLVATLLSFYVLSKKLSVIKEVSVFTIAFLTLSKVVVLVVIYKIFSRFYVLLTLGVFISMTLVINIAETLKEDYPNTIYSYHAHSITEHLGFTQYFNDKDNTILPDLLGSSSIAGALILGNDPNESAESLFVSKIKDFNWLSLFFIPFFIYFMFTLDREKRFYFVVFLLLQLFTGMSNHPVCYLPLFLIFSGKAYTYETSNKK
jgi:hypothetical protein